MCAHAAVPIATRNESGPGLIVHNFYVGAVAAVAPVGDLLEERGEPIPEVLMGLVDAERDRECVCLREQNVNGERRSSGRSFDVAPKRAEL